MDRKRQENEIDLRQLWGAVSRRQWAILGAAALVSLIAALVMSTVTPVYRASSTLLIESDQKNIVSIDEVYGVDTRSEQYYETQFEILRSRSIADAVIDELGLINDASFRGSAEGGNGLLGMFRGDRSQRVSNPRQETVATYFRNLLVEPVTKTQLVHVRFDSADPELAARVANAHAQAYIGSIVTAREDVTQSAASSMSERLEGLKLRLLESEARLQEFREQEQLIDADGVKSLPAREINDLTARLVEARRKYSVARIAYMQAFPNGEVTPDNLGSVPAVLDDRVVQQFQETEAEAAQLVAELGKRYGPKHPKMIAAQGQLANARESLGRQQSSVADSIRRDYEAARSEVTALEQALDTAKAQYQDMGRKESRLADLQQEVNSNRELYEIFYSRIKETVETLDLATANVRVLTAALVPNEPYKPRKGLVVALAFALTLGFGVIVAFFLEGMDNKVRNASDVSAAFDVPPLAAVPYIRNSRDIFRHRVMVGAYACSLLLVGASTVFIIAQ
jgi:uncharacterized protein involved in exopolysaccharide biosynthesis